MSTWAYRTFSGLPRTFWFLWLGTLINRVGIFVVPFLTLFLTSQRGLDVREASLVVSMFGFGSFVSQFIGGYLTDHIGRRITMLASLFGTPVILVLLSDLQNYAQIAITTLLLGFFSDLYRPASSALIADIIAPEHRPRAYTLRFWAINLGAAVSIALGGYLAEQDYRLLFYGDALTTFLFGIVIVLYVGETRPKRKHDHAAGMVTPSETPLLVFALLLTVLLLVVNSVYAQVNVTLPLAMAADGLSTVEYGNVTALNGVIIVLLSLGMADGIARAPRLPALAAGTLLIGAGYGVYVFADGVLLYGVGLVVWTIGEIITAPISTTLMADLAPLHRRGFYQGLLGSAYGLSAAAGPIVGGELYARFGVDALWLSCLAGCAAAAVCMLALRGMYTRLAAQVGG